MQAQSTDWRQSIATAALDAFIKPPVPPAELVDRNTIRCGSVLYGREEYYGAVIVALDSQGPRVVSRVYEAAKYSTPDDYTGSRKLRSVAWGRVTQMLNEDTTGANYYVVRRYGDGTIIVYNGMHSILWEQEAKVRRVPGGAVWAE